MYLQCSGYYQSLLTRYFFSKFSDIMTLKVPYGTQCLIVAQLKGYLEKLWLKKETVTEDGNCS